MRAKYGNRKITREGMTFDSVKEYKRYCELRLMQRAGVIHDLRCQVPFELIPSQKENGKTVERPVQYIADFVYEKDGVTVVEDTKGCKTKEYIIKRKLMRYLLHIGVVEI